MIYTLQENQSFDAEILRQELVAALGPDNWHINTAGNTVEFVGDFDPTATIEAHFAGGAKRKHNADILKQIADLEASVTPRRFREAATGKDKVWLKNLDDEITNLRGQLQ